MVCDLPLLTNDSTNSTVSKYVKHTGVTVAWVKQRVRAGKPCARSFCGIPVEKGGEVRWVVLVDSMNEKLPESEDIQATYRLIGSFLGRILGGG